MRLFYFLILLAIPFHSFAQVCNENSFNAPDPDASPNTYNCTTLDIGTAGINKVGDQNADPFIIIVTGNVLIRGNVNVSGASGTTATADPTTPVQFISSAGGPAAGNGGGVSGGEGEPQFALNPEEGLSPPRNGVCNDGGAGAGGFALAGSPGRDCSNNPSVAATGGVIWTTGFPSPLRGGFGGAAGGAHDVAGVFNVGTGGGGGGAIQIQSTTGTITISSGVTISARGGNGGNATSIGGGGGGGSGGVIVIDGFLGVINNGTLDVRGGAGGTSSLAGEGGAGASGVYRIINAGTTTDGTGVTTPTSSSSASSKLSSDISCGTVAKKNDNSMMFQMFAGFALAAFASVILRRKTR